MKSFVNGLMAMSMMMAGQGVGAQGLSSATTSAMDLTCRAKAKEIATKTYNTCVTDSRNAQIEQIRNDYQKQLAELTIRYDKELKRMGSKEITSTDVALPPRTTVKTKKPKTTASTGSKPKATKGIARTLPTRMEVKANTAPVITSSPLTLEQRLDDATAMPEEPSNVPPLPSSDEAAAAAAATQNDMQLTLVPDSPSGNEQY